jgi:predicted dehydrogenase
VSSENRIRVAVVGAGKFGAKRAMAIAKNPASEIRVVADKVSESARTLAANVGCEHSINWEETVARKDVDAVVVATSTQFLSEVTLAALVAGKHVLCEKPFARTADEAQISADEAAKRGLLLKVGYNHRYHPAIAKAHELFKQGVVGEIQFLRCLYGHGGRQGYEREWRANPKLSGGGQLLDQGVHALDLFRWFLGEFTEVKAFNTTSYWPIAPAEDNVFALLRTKQGQVATLHASWTNWKNVFAFDIFGENGFLAITGLGGHYGPERLCLGLRHNIGARPEERWFEYEGPDESLGEEWKDFLDCIATGRQPASSGEESLRTLQLVQAIYQASDDIQGAMVPSSSDRSLSSSASV